MEPEAEDAESSEILEPWSGSDGSQELFVSELYNEGDFSDAEYPSGQESRHLPKSDPESPECLASQEWESAQKQQSVHELSGTEDDVSYREEDDIYLSESRGSVTESPQDPTSPTSLSPPPEHPDPESHADQIPQLPSSSSAIGCLADTTLALTLKAEPPQGASNRHGPRTGNRRVESSEEGGSSEAPPASVFFGISNEGAEQAEKWNSESDTDLCRRDRHRARCTRLSRNESQSERHVKETKSKCKRIARLLTDAPNPQNKGALLFNRRRQRVKKFTLVSYGTGENEFDSQDQIEEEEEEEEEVRTAGYNFIATSDSELEEEYSVYQRQCNLSLNWARVREMEALPETKGKGVLMFAQRRQRMDEIALEHEELRGKGLPVEPLREPECAEEKDIYDDKEMYMHTEQGNYMDANIPEMNHHTNVPKPLVPNRTAKPFLGGQASPTAPAMPGGNAPAAKKPDLKFKVPVPINTNPHVWSPTSDIIASRDERIAVPAIKSGILPESKRKSNNKQQPAQKQESDPHLQNKGDRRSYIESEEDCFSLGAEACNFMQPRTVKLKNPPPVAPKPTINPMCPPWMRSSFGEPYVPPRSPVSQPSPVGPQGQHYLQQQEWAPPQQMAGRWAPDQAQAMLQTPAGAWAPIGSPSQLHLQPTANSWSQQSPRSPVSMQAHSPTYSPHHSPLPSKNKSDSTQNSVASCPPQAGKSYPHVSRAPQASPMGRGVSRGGGGGAQSMMGKGAELFAKRQSRMEKFVVDSETVQSNKTRTPSPTSSLPNSWRYSSNVRAPPPLSYNPLLSPFYPAAAKQAPSTSPKIKPKTKEKPKAPPKHLNALDIMKHQPYQLDTSLFTYDAFAEAKSPSPKPTPQSKFEVTKNLKQRFAPSKPSHVSEVDSESKPEVSLKAARLVSALNSSDRQNTKPAEPVANDEQLDEKLTALLAANHITTKQAQSVRPASSASQRSSTDESIASAFSPASLIARGVRQMAPRPKFSAKKPVVTTKQWKSVAMTN